MSQERERLLTCLQNNTEQRQEILRELHEREQWETALKNAKDQDDEHIYSD